jgi:hypothetical protein
MVSTRWRRRNRSRSKTSSDDSIDAARGERLADVAGGWYGESSTSRAGGGGEATLRAGAAGGGIDGGEMGTPHFLQLA